MNEMVFDHYNNPNTLLDITDDGKYVFNVEGDHRLMQPNDETNDTLCISLFFENVSEKNTFQSDLLLQFSEDWYISKVTNNIAEKNKLC